MALGSSGGEGLEGSKGWREGFKVRGVPLVIRANRDPVGVVGCWFWWQSTSEAMCAAWKILVLCIWCSLLEEVLDI